MSANSVFVPAELPLVVELDGTLTPADTLWEGLVRLIKREPRSLFLLPIWLCRGRAYFAARVWERGAWRGQGLPLHLELQRYLIEQHRLGRKLVLATTANQELAQEISDRLGLFDAVIGLENHSNRKGQTKLAAIRDRVGEHFSYAGSSSADAPVWHGAARAVFVGDIERLRTLCPNSDVEAEFRSAKAGWSTWLRAIRVHQWLKNGLVFVPLLTSFSLLDMHRLALAAIAFGAFSLCASATYIVNDLWDLDNDRAHPRKSKRPLASCEIPIAVALAASAAFLLCGFGLAFAASGRLAALLTVYLVSTSAYSWLLKRFVVADVLTLACLYTIRILAGAVAIEVPLSSWLLAFSVFLFFSLALVKRCAELVSLAESPHQGAAGRNYNISDLDVLWPTGVGAGMASVVVFGLFINSPETQSQYAAPHVMWLVALILLYWLLRLWIKTGRGEMHDDPLIYSIRDLNSRTSIMLVVLCSLVARFAKGL
jgi:4-hydroxybenzoate polyprenyltransferase